MGKLDLGDISIIDPNPPYLGPPRMAHGIDSNMGRY
jgi:hypothetical protein